MATRIQRSRSKPPSEKASYHQLLGAGTRRVLRKFFGLSPRDEQELSQEIDRRLTRHLRA